jgi:CDP-diglyceride synthetase
MKTRIIVGVLLVLLLIAVLYFGGFILLSVLSLFSIAAIYEMGLTFRKKGYNPIVIPAYIFAVSYAFVFFYFGLLSMIILFMATVMATMIFSLFTKVHSTNDIVPSLFIMIYPTLFLMCMLLVYFSFDRPTALVAAGMAYAAPECSDTFAYFGGKDRGRRGVCAGRRSGVRGRHVLFAAHMGRRRSCCRTAFAGPWVRRAFTIWRPVCFDH